MLMTLPMFDFRLPGFGLFGGGSTPVDTSADDKAKADAARKTRQAIAKRRGRSASLIAPSEDKLGNAPVTRPAASGGKGLG